MSAAQQRRERSDWIRCPLIVFTADGSKVLVTRGAAGLFLPVVGIPAQVRLAAGLTSATEQFLGVPTVHSFSLPSLSGSTAYRVMECIADNYELSAAFEWKPLRELTADCFTGQADFQAVLAALSQRKDATTLPAQQFYTLGWFPQVQQWVSESVEKWGLRLTSTFQQWNAAPGFSLIRFVTDECAVWFKAVAAPLADELEITRTLCQLFPDHTVRLVAVNRKWNAWLSLEADGSCLDEVCCPQAWQYVAGRLADLQIRSIPHADKILESGAANLSRPEIIERIKSLIDCARRLMTQQTKPSPPALTERQLDDLQHRIEVSLAEAAAIAPPEALGNIDFNPGNVIVNPATSCTFLDWAGAYVGYPFATFEYLLEHLRRQANASLGAEARLRQAYWKRWRELLSEAQIAELRRLNPLLSVFFFAEELCRQRGGVIDEATAPYMRSLLRRMKREADRIGGALASAPARDGE